ncbi:Glucan endo-1,3-beta-D-glucosidase [Linum perenne]
MKGTYILFFLLFIILFQTFSLANGQAKLFWCVPRQGVADAQLQANLDYVCGQPDMDCSPIQPGGACYEPNTVASHASFAMNLYFQKHGKRHDCDFSNTATFTNTDPSYNKCEYIIKP